MTINWQNHPNWNKPLARMSKKQLEKEIERLEKICTEDESWQHKVSRRYNAANEMMNNLSKDDSSPSM